MSEKLHYSLIGEPELLDVVDDDWLRACLPDDGALAVSNMTATHNPSLNVCLTPKQPQTTKAGNDACRRPTS